MTEHQTDDAARAWAVDPRNNVVLEASAGTGKTTVLVQRYLNLLRAGVEPANILAVTFTRKAATEMRERIIRELRAAAALSRADRARWLALRDRLSEISISTIDAFCLSLLREFPLEADLDPGFDMADETEVPRLVEEALDRSMRVFTALARSDRDVALVLAQLGQARTRAGLALLLERRLVASSALDRFLVRQQGDLDGAAVALAAADHLANALQRVPGGLEAFLAAGPSRHPRFGLFVREVRRLQGREWRTDADVRTMLDRIGLHFLTQDGSARRGGSIHPYNKSHYPSEAAASRHRDAVFSLAPEIERVARHFARQLNAILARGIRRMFVVAQEQYRRTLDARSALDFSDVLERALDLLRRMDEFSQSRYRLEARYHHVLVDEFQDTSRAQWELVSLLIQAWGAGAGPAANPSIFIVGDRKQSIYRFRDAEVAVLREAGQYIERLRPEGGARRSISRSFRAVPELLEFVNEVCSEMSGPQTRADSFTYADADRFPPAPPADELRGPALGVAVAESADEAAANVAAEIARILQDEIVRDAKTGVPRPARPGDIAILFRSRTSHREFETELERRNVPTYVYKGLGFFDADEIKDAAALLRFLAQPASELRAAALLRSGFARLSDAALAALTPNLAGVIAGKPSSGALDKEDEAVVAHLQRHMPEWIALVDRLPPADLFEAMLPELAYAYELRGRRRQQAWENLKKMRGLIRRIQNRGYTTLARIADHIDALSAGDDSNAVLEAVDAVNLMTIHASKGLEFPVVFVVNMARGASGVARPVRVVVDGEGGDPSVSIGPFVSDVDEIERDRELHESRRLLYVAMTRARDRLYLSSILKEGALAPGRGSLAEVLPSTIRDVLVRAAGGGERLTHTAASGRTFTWRVCRPAGDPADSAVGETRGEQAVRAHLTAPLAPGAAHRRLTVTEWVDGSAERHGGGGDTTSLMGRLVHRLFHAETLGHPVPPFRPAPASSQPSLFDPVTPVDVVEHELLQHAARLVTAVERAATPEPDSVVRRAVEAWLQIRHRPEVVELLTGGRCYGEVPFSLRAPELGGGVLRGTIDLLVVSDTRVAVVEFKTGSPQPSHRLQLSIYCRAAEALFPGRQVDGRLIYHEV